MTETTSYIPESIDSRTLVSTGDMLAGFIPKVSAAMPLKALFSTWNNQYDKEERCKQRAELYHDEIQRIIGHEVSIESLTAIQLDMDNPEYAFIVNKLPPALVSEIQDQDRQMVNETRRSVLELGGTAGAASLVGGMIGGIPGMIAGLFTGTIGGAAARAADKSMQEEIDLPSTTPIVMAIHRDMQMQWEAAQAPDASANAMERIHADPAMVAALLISMNRKTAEAFENTSYGDEVDKPKEDLASLDCLVQEHINDRQEHFEKTGKHLAANNSLLSVYMDKFLNQDGNDEVLRGECGCQNRAPQDFRSLAEEIAPLIQKPQDVNELVFKGPQEFLRSRRMQQVQQVTQDLRNSGVVPGGPSGASPQPTAYYNGVQQPAVTSSLGLS